MLLRWKNGPYPKEVGDGTGKVYQVDPKDGTVLGDVATRPGTKMLGTGDYEAIVEHQVVAELQDRFAKQIFQAAPPTIEECIRILLLAAGGSPDLAARLDAVFGRHGESDDEGAVGRPGPEAFVEQPPAADEHHSQVVEPVPMTLPAEDEEDFEDPTVPSAASVIPSFNPTTATLPEKQAEAFRMLEMFKGQGRAPLFEIFRNRGIAVSTKDNQITMIGRLCGLEPGWDQQG